MAHYNRTNTRYIIMETGSGKHIETIVRYDEYGNPSDIYENTSNSTVRTCTDSSSST